MTAATAYRFSTVRGRTIRLTKLDGCGNPVAGAANQFISTGFITVKATKNMDSGTEVKLPNANDQVVVYEPGRQTLLDFSLEIDFVLNDSGAIPFLTGDPAVLDNNSAVAGWEEQALQLPSAYWALELWTGVSGQACVGANAEFGYWLYPFVGNAYVDNDDVTNKDSNFSIKAQTFGPNAWGTGPYDVVDTGTDGTVTPGKLLAAVDAATHRHFQLTTIAPPAQPANAGPQTLTLS